MKLLAAVLLFFIQIPSNKDVQGDIVDDLILQFKNGNAKEIAKNFAPSVELLIIDQEDVYSKAQSEQILRDFFVKNSPLKATVIHRLNSNPNFKYGIFSLQTKNLKYRVTITLMKQKNANAFLITELRIEKD
ncbi:hypothetical protein D9M68_710680 [compost metagenome]